MNTKKRLIEQELRKTYDKAVLLEQIDFLAWQLSEGFSGGGTKEHYLKQSRRQAEVNVRGRDDG